MKNKISISFFVALFFIVLPNTNCSKDGGGDGFFIPILSNAWVNKNDNLNEFFFNADTDSTNTSAFTGNENLSIGGQDHFTGSFTNHNIQFTYDNNSSDNKSGKTYSGTINDASNVITLHSNDLDDLVLQKQ
jgi:hypothetical protein